jgi:hypothetical protein
MRSCTFGVVVVSAPAEMQRARVRPAWHDRRECSVTPAFVAKARNHSSTSSVARASDNQGRFVYHGTRPRTRIAEERS